MNLIFYSLVIPIFTLNVHNNRLNQIEFLIRFHRFWDAYTELTNIISQESYPIDNRLYRLRAQCTLSMGMTKECLEDCKKILQNNPSDSDIQVAYSYRARSLIQIGDYEGALDDAINANDRQLQSDCEQLNKLVGDAYVDIEDGNLEHAAQIFDTVLQHSPKAQQIVLDRATIAFQLFDYNKFKQLTNDFDKEFSHDGHYVYRKAIVSFCDGQMGQAMRGIKKSQSLADSPKNASRTFHSIEKVNKHYPTAEKYLNEDKIEDAKRHFKIAKDSAVSFCPNDSVLMKTINLFELKILKKEKSREELLEVLNDLLKNDPNNVDLMLERGDIHLELEDYDAALFDYQNAQRHRPNDSRIQKSLNEAQELKKKANYVDHYAILEVEKTASTYDIKQSYKKLVRQWHPDRFPEKQKKVEAEAKMKKINQAFDILSDPEKKRLYDAGQDPDNPNQGGANFQSPFDFFFQNGGGQQFHFAGGNGFHFHFNF